MATKDLEKRTSIKVRNSTIIKLKEEGTMGETYDDVIRRLLFKKRTGGNPDGETDKKIARLI